MLANKDDTNHKYVVCKQYKLLCTDAIKPIIRVVTVTNTTEGGGGGEELSLALDFFFRLYMIISHGFLKISSSDILD